MRAAVEDGRLILRFADGETVEGDVQLLGEHVETNFYGRPWWVAWSRGHGQNRCRSWRGGPYASREPSWRVTVTTAGPTGASLVSIASLEALRAASGVEQPDDGRRFRMTIGIDGVEAHGEDDWIGSGVRVGGAAILVREHVGRCAVTTRDPDTGIRDLETLDVIAAYRDGVPSVEPLPFGVWCEVVEPAGSR